MNKQYITNKLYVALLCVVVFLTWSFIFPPMANAACTCACVSGEVQILCTGPANMEIKPICPPQICPITPPSIAPLSPPQLPPLGTSHCEQKQVLNPYTHQYEWKSVCE